MVPLFLPSLAHDYHSIFTFSMPQAHTSGGPIWIILFSLKDMSKISYCSFRIFRFLFPLAPRPKSVIFEPFSVIRSFLTNFNVQYGYGKLLTYRLRQFCPFWKISKNEQPTPKGSKIKLLSLDAKGNKNRKIWNKHPKTFWHIFQGKKDY